jgi:hypothetical protein
MNNLQIDCVWCPSRRDFNKFIKGTIKESTKIIDFFSIKNKLIKADPYCGDPNDSIIGLTIINEITRCLRSDTKDVDRVIYVFRSLDSDIVSNFKKLIQTNTERELLISLIIIDKYKKIDETILSQFDSVKLIPND